MDEITERFEIIYEQLAKCKKYNHSYIVQILLDKETGVNYLMSSNGEITVLLDSEEQPVITK